jgi:hypothetical protein
VAVVGAGEHTMPQEKDDAFDVILELSKVFNPKYTNTKPPV